MTLARNRSPASDRAPAVTVGRRARACDTASPPDPPARIGIRSGRAAPSARDRRRLIEDRDAARRAMPALHWRSTPAESAQTPEDGGARPVLATLRNDPGPRSRSWTEVAVLVRRAQAGDREAFGRLVEQFQRTVHAICLRRLGNPSEAVELTQEVFLHVMRRIDQLREPERFAGWLRQVAVRMAINRATRRIAAAERRDRRPRRRPASSATTRSTS